MSRQMVTSGKSAVAFLGLAIAWSVFWTTPGGMDSASTSRAEETVPSEDFVVLEFIDKDVPQYGKTKSLIDEMRRKNYPIQLVERATGGDVLFDQYDVETTPAFVFLVNGKEAKRFVVADESVKDVRDQLLALFRECRNGKSRASESVTTRGQVPETERFATSGAPDNSVRPKYGRTVSVPPRQDSALPVNPSTSFPAPDADLATNANSYAANASNPRSGLTLVRAFVGVRGSTEERVGVGVVAHYNEEYGEALTLVPASLFAGVDDPINKTNTTLDLISPTSESREKVVGQCVFCDVQAGLAFVAARVATPVAPVAFLPKNDVPRVGETAIVASFNNNNEFVPTKCDVASVESGSLRLTVADGQERRGSGVFLVRNERLYFAGLYLANDADGRGVVASVAAIDQILIANGNLSTVYRDQASGKYEPLELVGFETQRSDPLLASTSRVDLNDVAPSTNMANVFKAADVESDVLNALSKLPKGDEGAPNDPNLRLDSPNAPSLDAAPVFANDNSRSPAETSVSDMPSVLKKNLDSNVGVGAGSANVADGSIALATNENYAMEPRAQEIPTARRDVDGTLADANEIRSTNYASRQNDRIAAPTDQETRLLESSLDELRRLSLEGAEIICIVNWGPSSGESKARETEVVRLPRRKTAVPTNAKQNVGVVPVNATPATQVPQENRSATTNASPVQKTTGVSDLSFLR